MTDALGAQAGCVARLLPAAAQQPARVMTLALSVNGALKPNRDYLLDGTPSAQLLTQRQFVVERDVAGRYPDAPVLRELGAQGYVGQQLCNADGEPLGLIFVLFREPLHQAGFITSMLQIFAARAAAEIQRQQAEARIRYQASLLDKAQDAIVVRDLAHRILFWNQGAERLYGWTRLQALGQSAQALLYDDPAVFARATHTALEKGEWVGEITQHNRHGDTLDMEAHWTRIPGEDGQPPSILEINTDISARKASEREVQRLAFYDALTGLPNRMLLMDRMQQALASAERQRQGGALLFIDLDNFKTLNDTLGHDMGDLLLQQVAQRLGSCVRSIDTVARLGGDEFVVMIEQLSSEPAELARAARAVGEKILQLLSAPYLLAGYQYRSTPSIGIAPFDHGRTSVGELLKQADLAMYQAKTAGRSTLRFFDPDMQAAVTQRATLEGDLRAAFAKDEFLLQYQPQSDRSGRVVGVEALVRWRHPRRGLVAPAEFIGLAEETGLILPLGRWVLNQACKLLARWQGDPYLAQLTMAVNVSSLQFRDTNFVEDVLRVLAVNGAPANRLKLELTESLLVENMEATIATMEALCAHGVGFALDDFGTGYSSLTYLKRMPLTQLKIDRSFVRDLLTDPNDAAIIHTIIALSRSLGLEVIAEGVESIEQRDMLARAGCHFYQGYLCSPALSEDALQRFVRDRVG
jgi:diguanylate cyclase (GGDEF)-like protein/PAS domain S-box-containing protein